MCAGDRGPETEEMKERKTIRVHDPNHKNNGKNSNGGRNRRRVKSGVVNCHVHCIFMKKHWKCIKKLVKIFQ